MRSSHLSHTCVFRKLSKYMPAKLILYDDLSDKSIKRMPIAQPPVYSRISLACLFVIACPLFSNSNLISLPENCKLPASMTASSSFATISEKLSGGASRLRSRIKQFAGRHNLILFVAGKKSSNGKVLFEECKKANPNTYLISDPQEINPKWLQNIHSIGICGATSTPKWLMESVADAVKHV